MRESIEKKIKEDFDADDLPKVEKRLADFDDIPDFAKAASVNSFMAWRKRLNKDIRFSASKQQAEQKAALQQMKGMADEYIQGQFAKDMVSGDKTAITKWRKYLKEYSEFKNIFDDDRMLVKLRKDKLNPEQVNAFIFGSSEAGFSPGS